MLLTVNWFQHWLWLFCNYVVRIISHILPNAANFQLLVWWHFQAPANNWNDATKEQRCQCMIVSEWILYLTSSRIEIRLLEKSRWRSASQNTLWTQVHTNAIVAGRYHHRRSPNLRIGRGKSGLSRTWRISANACITIEQHPKGRRCPNHYYVPLSVYSVL